MFLATIRMLHDWKDGLTSLLDRSASNCGRQPLEPPSAVDRSYWLLDLVLLKPPRLVPFAPPSPPSLHRD